MTIDIREWWEGIEENYGSLDTFTDATTVREVRRECIKWIAGDVTTLLSLEPYPVILADYDDDALQEQRAFVTKVVKACTQWLRARGLEP